MSEQPTCAQCGTTDMVRYFSPDMDIKPVPLCFPCWYQILDPHGFDGKERTGA